MSYWPPSRQLSILSAKRLGRCLLRVPKSDMNRCSSPLRLQILHLGQSRHFLQLHRWQVQICRETDGLKFELRVHFAQRMVIITGAIDGATACQLPQVWCLGEPGSLKIFTVRWSSKTPMFICRSCSGALSPCAMLSA
jgi:hypothetical protein